MATPAFIVDGTSELSASVLNRGLMSDGTATGVKVWHGRVLYNGADFEVNAVSDSAGLTTGALSFNSGDTTIDITLSGFTNAPVVVMSPQTLAAYETKISTCTSVLLAVAFFDPTTGVQVTTGTEDTSMDFNIILMGA